MITTHELALAASINLENLDNGLGEWTPEDENDLCMVSMALEEIAGRLD